MGWRLAEEIAWRRPERPGAEWWTLMDIAQDARDETRQGMPGTDYLMARGKCSRATVYRRLKALTDAGLLSVARRSAPGVRAIYKIPVIHSLPKTGLRIVETCEPVDNPGTGLSSCETRSEAERVSKPAQRVSKTAATGLTPLRDADSVSTNPSYNPVNPEAPVDGGPVEGAQLSTGEPSGEIISQPVAAFRRSRWQDPAELARQQAEESRRQRLAGEARAQ